MKQRREACGCCEGIEVVTPESTANRPGLSVLSYRIGTHATFLETMLARLSSSDYPPLAKLTTRESDDPSIALLDAWAIVADVLTFYQERIINEGYLRTAIERRSILELARLVGYKLRPGVSSSVYLAYTLDENFKEDVTIPIGARSQSIPGPGELPQSFETSEELKARAKWNNLRPRMSRPQTGLSILLNAKGPRIYLKGINTNLKPNDPLLIDFNDPLINEIRWESAPTPVFFRVKEVITEPLMDRSLVLLQTNSEQFSVSTKEEFLDVLERNDDIEIILLDRGDELPGFFILELEDTDSEIVITLFSIKDGKAWSFDIVSFDDELYVSLSETGNEFLYKIKEVGLIANGLIPYLRIALQAEQSYSDILAALALPPSVQPQNELRLKKGVKEQFTGFASVKKESSLPIPQFSRSVRSIRRATSRLRGRANVPGLNVVAEGSNAVAKTMTPLLSDNLATANANANVTSENLVKVYALRAKALLFGNAVPDEPVYQNKDGVIEIVSYKLPVISKVWARLIDEGWIKAKGNEDIPIVATDIQLDEVIEGSWLVIDRPEFKDPRNLNISSERLVTIHKVKNHQMVSNSAQGVSSKTSLLVIDKPWLQKSELEDKITVDRLLNESTTLLRSTRLYTQSENLELADEPIHNSICGGVDDLIELDGYYEDLQAGRWAAVSGERADVTGTNSVKSSELAMISVVRQDISHQILLGKEDVGFQLPGDKIHTFIKLAEPLQYCFKRDTITINGNVVKATHGETRNEVLGSGDGAKALESFVLKQPPLTYVSAANPSGVDSTLKVYVNDVQWHETEVMAGLSMTDRDFITKTDDEGKTTVIFGNGREGARLPTGIENIKAEYRNGIGKPGNVKAQQIALLTTRPLGVKEVINPLQATGGADKENRDQARKNTPLAVKALDRLVSVQDYEDFARVYAGIGKARATEISDGRRQIVHITIAGADDIPIDKNSDLYRNLRQSLLDFGDPYQPIHLEVRELMVIVIQASLRILPDYQWESVVTQVRMALLDAFSFERRELGQDVLLSEVLSVMQAVRGVAFVDVDVLRGVPEKIVDAVHPGQRRLLTPGEIASLISKPLVDPNYELLLLNLNLDGSDDLELAGRNLIIVALIDFTLHIFIFDGVGNMVVDKEEDDLIQGDTLDFLRQQVELHANSTDLPQQLKQEIMQNALVVANYILVKEPVSRISVNLAAIKEGTIQPAQLAFLTPDVPATLILNQIP